MHLAELNISYFKHRPETGRLDDFLNAVDRINALAERSPGFLWRWQDEGGEVTDERQATNMSVWESPAALAHYVFNTAHVQIYKRKDDWMADVSRPLFVMWWVAEGHHPTLTEGMERLAHLQTHGPSDHAFGWEAMDMSAFRHCAHAAE